MNPLKQLERELAEADSYKQWSAVARQMDEATGKYAWREIERSRDYDYVSIRTRLERLRSLRKRRDYSGLLFALNEGVHGNMGGMGKAVLYSYTMLGTKCLIEEYIKEIILALKLIAEKEIAGVDKKDKIDFFERAKACFGSSALMLSGSGTLFFFHLGVMRALREVDLMPRVISGSSGGSFVGCMVASHDEKELDKRLTVEFFLDIVEEMREVEREFGGRPYVVSDQVIRAMVAACLPDITFQESFEKTGIRMNVSVAPHEVHQTSRLLNHITSPNVCLREAAIASMAAPGFFSPASLIAKDVDGSKKPYLPDRKWVDGAMSDDLPAKRLSRLYGVNHFVVSQTNPHIIPFVTDTISREESTSAALKSAFTRVSREAVLGGLGVSHSIFPNRSNMARIIGAMRSLISQDYIGDINILPPFRMSNPLKLLAIPDENYIRRLMDAGERATWPKIEMIRNQTRISNEIDRLVDEHF